MLKACEDHGFRPDTVQMPLNLMDASHESFQARVLPELVRRGIGVLGMKPFGDHALLDIDELSPLECLHYAMSIPGVSATITGIDEPKILDQALGLARGFAPLSEAQRRALEAKVARFAQGGKYEGYKSSTKFDSTEHHPEWLG